MRHLATVLIAAGFSAVLSLAYNAIVARQLGPGAYSEFATALAIATMFACAGGALAPITAHLSARYMATGEPEKIRGLVATLQRRLLPILLVGAFVTMVTASPVAHLVRFESALSLLVAYGALAGLILLGVARSASRGAQEFQQFGLGVFGETVVRLVAGGALLIVWPHPAAALGGYIVGYAVTCAWSLRNLRALSPIVAPVPRSDVTDLLGATTALVVVMAAFQNIDLILVRRVFAAEEAGIYAAAVSLARWMALVAFPFEALLVPQLTYLGDRGNSIVGVAARLGGGFLVLAAIPLALFATIPTLIVTSLYGGRYQEAAPLLFVLGVGVFAQYACYLLVQVLVSRGRRWSVVLFAAMGIIEALTVSLWHDSLLFIAMVLCTMRVVALLAILTGAWATTRRVSYGRSA